MKQNKIIIYSVIIVLVIGLFSYYLFIRNSANTKLDNLSDSDQTSDIEKELNDTNINVLGAETTEIESLLNKN